MRLLYVDDDRINVLLFEETCRLDAGLEVCTATSGAEAEALAREFHPEVLVIDLHLPDTDGYALLAALRRQKGLQAAPAYLCSAERLRDIEQAAADAGFTGCWSKPVMLRDMLDDLSRHQNEG